MVLTARDCHKVYIKICPECLRSATAPFTETMNRLKMISSETIGSRAQMDFIGYRWKEWKGYKWIL
jgi:hypothetical protein